MNTTRSFNLNRDIAMDEEIHRFRDNLASVSFANCFLSIQNQEVILRGVINRILGVQLEGDLVEALQDGIVLFDVFDLSNRYYVNCSENQFQTEISQNLILQRVWCYIILFI